jgi:hypothetical protein
MSVNPFDSWLDDGALSHFAGQGPRDPSLWAQRYDATCPSEFYRGYATLLLRFNEAFPPRADMSALAALVEAFDSAIQGLPADERRNGASFALMNVASYAQMGTVQQVAATLIRELPCIAQCFVENRARGF